MTEQPKDELVELKARLLRDAIQFHVFAEAKEKDVAALIAALDESGLALVSIPEWYSAGEAQQAVNATLSASQQLAVGEDQWRCHNCKLVTSHFAVPPARCPQCRCRDFSAVAPSPVYCGRTIEALRDIASEAEFLLARIDELEWDVPDESYLARDWHGHVTPPLSRLGSLLDQLAALCLPSKGESGRHPGSEESQ